MEKRRAYQLLLALLFVGLITACTKSEVRTNRFFKQGRWMVTEMTIGANEVTNLPKWDITSEPEDKEFANGIWTHADGTDSEFVWRFDYYQGTFTFALNTAVSQDDTEKSFIQCQNLAGPYEILTDKKKLFEFQSTETHGYPGVNVYIKLEPL